MSNISLVATHCADSDIERTYPAVQQGLNGCKETTILELCEIEGASYLEHRVCGLNNMAGAINSVENIVTLCKAATLDEFVDSFLAEFGEV